MADSEPLERLPGQLHASELGTKEYWDAYYTSDLINTNTTSSSTRTSNDPSPATAADLPTWFDDVNAPRKILDFLFSAAFPLSPTSEARGHGEDVDAAVGASQAPSVLDLGTGNGSMLFQLREGRRGGAASESGSDSDSKGNEDGEGEEEEEARRGYTGAMYGVDYSERSIELARALQASRTLRSGSAGGWEDVQFHVMDVVSQRPRDMAWWPRQTGNREGNGDGKGEVRLFDLVLDKGTFDAVSLSAETVDVDDGGDGRRRGVRLGEVYPQRVSRMVRVGGFLLVTSCNWTEEEVVRWFCPERGMRDEMEEMAVLEVFHRIRYPTFTFGGKKGAGVASVCFKRVR